MKITKKQTIGENLLYVMVWLVIILVPILNSQMMSELRIDFGNVLTAWLQILPYLIIFLVHNGLLAPRYMLRHKYWKYLSSNIIVIFCVFTPIYLFAESSAALETADELRKVSFSNLSMGWNVVLAIFMTGANSGIKLMYQSIRDEQRMEELKQQNMQAEMDYLKYQINPHFFMNTLNNIHALIDIDPEYAKNAVIELSKMMRYVLYDSGRERISLNRDIQFLKNYIELMRIRYTDAVDIRVTCPDDLPEQLSIPPLLLIVFVENAFKHGISYNRPSFIHLEIDCRDNTVAATIVNSRHMPSGSRRTVGIGLENVRKRLGLIYGEKNYMLDIREEPRTYTVRLEIPVLHA